MQYVDTELKGMDIRTAFLNAEIKEKVFSNSPQASKKKSNNL